MSVFCRAVVCLAVAVPGVAQSHAFARATIKRARSAEPRNERVRVLRNGDLIATATPPITLLAYAYDVPVNPSQRLSGVPEWAFHEPYDIAATAPADFTDGTRREMPSRIRKMIRGLLKDRFHLVMRITKKTMPVYTLRVARGGPKLQAASSAEKNCIFDTDPTKGCHAFINDALGHPLHAAAIDMSDLARYISNWTDLPVVNRTALIGLFSVGTEGWIPMRLPPPPPGATPAGNPLARFAGLPTIFTVLGKLGLELKRQQDTLPVYTVERFERPVAN